jgi:hypothetical protein
LGDLENGVVGGEFEAAGFFDGGVADVQDLFDFVDVQVDVVESGHDRIVNLFGPTSGGDPSSGVSCGARI